MDTFLVPVSKSKQYYLKKVDNFEHYYYLKRVNVQQRLQTER